MTEFDPRFPLESIFLNGNGLVTDAPSKIALILFSSNDILIFIGSFLTFVIPDEIRKICESNSEQPVSLPVMS